MLDNRQKDNDTSLTMLESILHAMHSYIYVTEMDSDRILFVNDSMTKGFGLTGLDMKGEQCWKFFQSGLSERCDFCPKRELTKNPNETVIWEERNTVTNRYYRHIDRIIDWPDGRKVHMQQCDDISDIEEAHKRALVMLDTMPISCTIWDENLQCVDCNASAVEFFEMKDKQECQDRFFEFSPEYQPDGQRSDEMARSYIKKAFAEGSSVFEWVHQNKDGMQIPTEMTLVRTLIKDDVIVLGYVSDLRHIKRLEEKLEIEIDKGYSDALTGISNRRYFDENLKRLVKTLARSGGKLSLMMVDIDHFKEYNDLYGHLAGDNCLRIIAETLQNTLKREDDFIARYGGEEFAIVMPNTDEKGARIIADKLLENIRSCAILHTGNESLDIVTVSIGVATGDMNHIHSVEELVALADSMLYKSKREGRNRYNFTDI